MAPVESGKTAEDYCEMVDKILGKGAVPLHNFYILSKKKRTICVKKYPLDGWMDELQTGPVGYMLKIPIG